MLPVVLKLSKSMKKSVTVGVGEANDMLPQQQRPQLWHLRKQQAGLLVEGNEIDEPEDLDLGEGLTSHRSWVTGMGQTGRTIGNSGCGYLCSLSTWPSHLLANSLIIGLINHSAAGTSED